MKSIMKLYILIILQIWLALSISAQENNFYTIRDIKIPDEIILEIGGLAFNDVGDLMACTRRGELWAIKNLNSENPEFLRYAQGLHEPLGIAYKDGSYYLAQRGELLKLSDTNSDGKADFFESIFSWPIAANYHEYAYGPVFLPDGNMLINLNLQWIGRGASLSKWAGWMLMVSPEGKMTPIATGLRSPAGLGLNKKGDIFYTENQGDWVGSGRMTHIEKGDFAGHVEGLKWANERDSPISLSMEKIMEDVASEPTTLYDYAQKVEGVKPPSVWFPHAIMGISTSDIEVIPDNFGPFEGQLLVGDQGHSKLMRVFQEKVNGVYQGICFDFVSGFSSGLLRTEWGPDNKLYVGMTNRGWASTGKSKFGLQTLEWSGKTPFEMKTVKVQPDGFLIEFTHPGDRSTLANPESYSIVDFTYNYHSVYGSKPIKQETRTIYKVEVNQDGTQAKLFVEGLRKGFVYEIKADKILDLEGQKLLHNVGYYTLNEIPGDNGNTTIDHGNHNSGNDEPVEIISDKRVTEIPSSWTNGPDSEIIITTKAGMLFDIELIEVKAGSKIKLVLNNPDDMMHNLLVINPGTVEVIAQQAMELGLEGMEKAYVPESEDVLAHTSLLQPGDSDIIYFTIPEKKGDYTFVCTFPAHAATMKGIIRVN